MRYNHSEHGTKSRQSLLLETCTNFDFNSYGYLGGGGGGLYWS